MRIKETNHDIMTAGKDKSQNMDSDSEYRAFLIRCWREGDTWRFTLETIGQMRQQHGFAGYQQLAGFLENLFSFEERGPNSNYQLGDPRK